MYKKTIHSFFYEVVHEKGNKNFRNKPYFAKLVITKKKSRAGFKLFGGGIFPTSITYFFVC